MVEAARAADVIEKLGPGEVLRTRSSEYAIWCQWPLLALILLVATVEWIIRKKAGLS